MIHSNPQVLVQICLQIFQNFLPLGLLRLVVLLPLADGEVLLGSREHPGGTSLSFLLESPFHLVVVQHSLDIVLRSLSLISLCQHGNGGRFHVILLLQGSLFCFSQLDTKPTKQFLHNLTHGHTRLHVCQRVATSTGRENLIGSCLVYSKVTFVAIRQLLNAAHHHILGISELTNLHGPLFGIQQGVRKLLLGNDQVFILAVKHCHL